jgi:hypothetical protein
MLRRARIPVSVIAALLACARGFAAGVDFDPALCPAYIESAKDPAKAVNPRLREFIARCAVAPAAAAPVRNRDAEHKSDARVRRMLADPFDRRGDDGTTTSGAAGAPPRNAGTMRASDFRPVSSVGPIGAEIPTLTSESGPPPKGLWRGWMDEGKKEFQDDQLRVNAAMAKLQEERKADCASWMSAACTANTATQAFGYFKTALNKTGESFTGGESVGDQAKAMGRFVWEYLTPAGGVEQVHDDYKAHGLEYFADKKNFVFAAASVLPFGKTLRVAREANTAIAAERSLAQVARQTGAVAGAATKDGLGMSGGAAVAVNDARAAVREQAINIHVTQFETYMRGLPPSTSRADALTAYLTEKKIALDAPLAVELLARAAAPAAILEGAQEIAKRFGGVDPTTLKGAPIAGKAGGETVSLQLDGETWYRKRISAAPDSIEPQLRKLTPVQRAQNELGGREIVRRYLSGSFGVASEAAVIKKDGQYFVMTRDVGGKPNEELFRALTVSQRADYALSRLVFRLEDMHKKNLLFGPNGVSFIDMEMIAREPLVMDMANPFTRQAVNSHIVLKNYPLVNRTAANELGPYLERFRAFQRDFKPEELRALLARSGWAEADAAAYVSAVEENMRNFERHIGIYVAEANAIQERGRAMSAVAGGRR